MRDDEYKEKMIKRPYLCLSITSKKEERMIDLTLWHCSTSPPLFFSIYRSYKSHSRDRTINFPITSLNLDCIVKVIIIIWYTGKETEGHRPQNVSVMRYKRETGVT